MSIPGESRKYVSEQSGKERPPRLRPLIFWLVIAVLVLLFAIFWTWPGLVQY